MSKFTPNQELRILAEVHGITEEYANESFSLCTSLPAIAYYLGHRPERVEIAVTGAGIPGPLCCENASWIAFRIVSTGIADPGKPMTPMLGFDLLSVLAGLVLQILDEKAEKQ